MQAAAKHASRSEPLAALVVVARAMLEQARAAEAERARVAAEAAAAAEAVKAAAEAERARVAAEAAAEAEAERTRVAAEEKAKAAAVKAAAEAAATAKRQQLEEEASELSLRVQSDTMRLQQVQAELGSGSGTPQPDDAESQCVLCLDAPKDHIIIPCGHQCVCEACAEKLKEARHPLCPFCRTPIHSTVKVFVV
jgi:hypothetical protein